jgi:O-methyltransferase involved in polyketide biosynthesis
MEGLLIYLTADETASLLHAATHLSAAGSHLACELHRSGVRRDELATPRLAPLTGMWKGGLGRDTPQWLTDHGWQVQVEARDALANAYGRPSPVPSDSGYITAIRTPA